MIDKFGCKQTFKITIVLFTIGFHPGYSETFFLSACLVTAGVALTLLLSKPEQQEEVGTAGRDNPDQAMMMGH